MKPWFYFCLVSVVVAASPAYADDITTLYNTGVDASGNPLPNGTQGDPHYSLTPIGSATGSTSSLQTYTSQGGYPVGPWLGDDSASDWIGPADYQADGPSGEYIYTTTFDLAGFDLSTISILGQLAEDDRLDNILINGHSLGIGNQNGFSSWTSFAVDQSDASGDFVSGTNTLQFIVDNTGGPTGFRMEVTSATGDLIASVPDSPVGLGTLAAMFTVLLSVAQLRNRRQAQ